MKKKIIALCLIVALAATAVIGGTLAYFTDTDSAKNTFTVGGVSIELIEQQTSENGLVSFEQEKPLVPGKSNDGNAQSKIVTVKNTGDNDAWVWVDMLIPTALLNPANPTDQSKNALHYNEYGAFSQGYWNTERYGISETNSAVTDGVFKADGNGGFVPTNSAMVNISAETVWTDWERVDTETIDNIEYTILRTKMVGALESDKISLPCLRQVYMDWRVTTTTENGETYYVAPDRTKISTTIPWEVIIRAYAIQADGIDDVDTAVTAYAKNGQ